MAGTWKSPTIGQQRSPLKNQEHQSHHWNYWSSFLKKQYHYSWFLQLKVILRLSRINFQTCSSAHRFKPEIQERSGIALSTSLSSCLFHILSAWKSIGIVLKQGDRWNSVFVHGMGQDKLKWIYCEPSDESFDSVVESSWDWIIERLSVLLWVINNQWLFNQVRIFQVIWL